MWSVLDCTLAVVHDCRQRYVGLRIPFTPVVSLVALNDTADIGMVQPFDFS